MPANSDLQKQLATSKCITFRSTRLQAVSLAPLEGPMTRHDPQQVSSLLQSYDSISKPSAEMTAEVEALLKSPREGIQVKAAQTLARWRRPSSKSHLREWLLSTYDRRHGSAVRAQAAKALALFIEPKDADWVLDLYFARAPRPRELSAVLEIRALLPLVAALPPSAVSQRATAEGESAEVNRRRAAIFALHAVGDARALRTFANDESQQLCRTAMNALRVWALTFNSTLRRPQTSNSSCSKCYSHTRGRSRR
jgi:hypothetical protein